MTMKTLVYNNSSSMPSKSSLLSVLSDSTKYGIASKQLELSKPKLQNKKRSKVDKALAGALNLKRAHQKHVSLSPVQMDKLCSSVRKLLVISFLAGAIAAGLCCWAVNASALHRAYINGYTSGKDSKAITYLTDK